MRHRIQFILILLLLCGGLGRAGEDQISVTAEVDKQSAYIGDIIDYSITIVYDSSIVLTPPAGGANLGGFEVKDYSAGEEEALKDGRRRQKLDFQIRTFTTGEFIIPPLMLEYMLPDSTRKNIYAEPIKIEVKSLLGEGYEADTLRIRPLRAQISLDDSSTLKTISYTVLALGLIAAALIYFFIIRGRKKEEEVVDLRPPWEIAFAELAMLREKSLPISGELKLFYLDLTDIFRTYLGRKFGFDAIDMTTEEIDEQLTKRSNDESLRSEIKDFLEEADLIKFAKFRPPDDQAETDWNRAYAYIEKTINAAVIVPEPVRIAAAVVDYGEFGDIDDPELRFAPPELREHFIQHREEDSQ